MIRLLLPSIKRILLKVAVHEVHVLYGSRLGYREGLRGQQAQEETKHKIFQFSVKGELCYFHANYAL